MKHAILFCALAAVLGLAAPQRTLAGAGAGVRQPEYARIRTNRKLDTLTWVLEQHRKAAGAGLGDLHRNQHTLYSIAASGLTGQLEEYDTGSGKYRVQLSLGPLNVTTADDGVQAWEQDSTGNVRIVRGPELTEQRATFSFSLENYDPLQPGKHKGAVTLRKQRDPSTKDYILDIVPIGGTSQVMYVNPRTFLVDKIEMHEGGLSGSMAISSYRKIAGSMVPVAFSVGYAGVAVEVNATLVSAKFDEHLDPVLFRTPVEARDYEFLQQQTASTGPPGSAAKADWATVPFESVDNEIILPVLVNGHKLRFLLDSGAASSFVTGAAAKEAGLVVEGDVAAVGYGGTAATGIASHETVEVPGALRLKGQLLYVIKDPSVAKHLHDRSGVDGALGYNVFARLVTRIDYPGHTLTFMAPEAAEAMENQTGSVKPISLPIKLQNHMPTVPAAIDGHKTAQFLVDTGDSGGIHLYTKYAQAEKLTNTLFSKGASVRLGVGVGGAVTEILTPGHSLTLGTCPVKNVTLATISSGGIQDISDFAGGIGNGVLSRFTATFDYANAVLLLSQVPLSSKQTASSPQSPVVPAPAAAGAGGSPAAPPPPPPPPLAVGVATTGGSPGAAAAPRGVASSISLAELMKRHLQALGGQASLDAIKNTRVTSTMTTGDAGGTVVTAFAMPDREFEEDHLGVLDVRQGYNGTTGWRIDGNGNERQLSDDEMRDMRNQIYFDTNSYVLTGRMPGVATLRPYRDADTTDYVVDVKPVGGKPATLYFNPNTFLIDREEHKDDDVTATTTFADYRRFDGVMFPVEQRISNGTPRYDITIRVTKVENNADIAPPLFDPPARSRTAVFVKPGATSASVKFELDDGEITIPVLIDGHAERFLFDSGASSIAISKSVVDGLKLKQGGLLEARGYGGSTDLHPVQVTSFEIPGAVRLVNVAAVSVTLPYTMSSMLDKPIAGFIGYDLLSQFVVHIDYDHRTISFSDPAAFTPAKADGAALAVQLNDDIPSVQAYVDNLAPADYLIDTGDVACLRMFEPYTSDNGLNKKYAGGISTSGGGIAGISRSRETRVSHFTVGGVTIYGLPVDFSEDPKGGTSDIDAGSIGAGLLTRLSLTFDFPHNRIFVAPTSRLRGTIPMPAEADAAEPEKRHG